MRLTYAMIKKLKLYFLEELPAYIEDRIAEIKDNKKHEDYIKEKSKQFNMIVRNTKRPFCKSISSLVAICLRHYNFEKISVRNTRFIIGNAKAKHLLNKYGLDELTKLFKKKPELRDGYYTLVVGFWDDPNDFHSVVLINDNMILDMTADQMNRPEHNIEVRNFWLKTKDMVRHIDSIISYEVSTEEINHSGFIFAHPDLKEIMNTISKKISKILNLNYKPFKSVIKYRQKAKDYVAPKI
jgi:hypothetical protein